MNILIQSDARPLNLAEPEPSDAELKIAELAMQFIHDGCTLQTGIGGIPSQVATALANGTGGDYGIHSEMFTTGLMRLHQASKVTNNKGNEFDGFSVTTFSAGIPELYEWLHNNDLVRFLPVRIVNSPDVISRQRFITTINGAMAVDLSGQIVADSVNGHQFSGIGGHEDFVSGPGLSQRGRSLICLPSTTVIDGKLVSRILPQLPTGSVVTTPRHHVDVVITEYGVAELQDLTINERSVALAKIGHPDFRDELIAASKEWPSD